MRARGLNLTRDIERRFTLTVELDRDSIADAKAAYDELRQGDVEITVKRWHDRRSLDANAYYWTLAGKLAAKVGAAPADIYLEHIKSVGDNYDVVCVRAEAADKLCSGWRRNGIGWMAETMPSKLSGCVNVLLYYGSSTYDTAQMSRLIDLAVTDCREQGIETMTPDELARLKARWADGEPCGT